MKINRKWCSSLYKKYLEYKKDEKSKVKEKKKSRKKRKKKTETMVEYIGKDDRKGYYNSSDSSKDDEIKRIKVNDYEENNGVDLGHFHSEEGDNNSQEKPYDAEKLLIIDKLMESESGVKIIMYFLIIII